MVKCDQYFNLGHVTVARYRCSGPMNAARREQSMLIRSLTSGSLVQHAVVSDHKVALRELWVRRDKGGREICPRDFRRFAPQEKTALYAEARPIFGLQKTRPIRATV